MLILSEAKLTVGSGGDVRVEGKFGPYWSRISAFVRTNGIRGITVRLRDGQLVFPRSIPSHTRRKLVSFLSLECPIG